MVDRVVNRLEMASRGILDMMYVADILYYTIIDGSWEIGIGNCKYFDMTQC
jgi:hypothetical protein